MSARPLRILSVGSMYPPHHQGGYELVWQSSVRTARAAGHTVRVLASTHRESGVDEPDEPDVHRVLRWYWDWHRHEAPRLTLRGRVALERSNAALLERHIAGFAPDIVVWWSMGHMSLSMIEQARRAGLPAVFSVHNDWLTYGWTADQWLRIWPHRRRAARIAEALIGLPTSVDIAGSGLLLFNSAYTRQAAAVAGVDTAGSRVIHPGIAPGFLAPAPAHPWRWRLLYVGRIDRAKGVDIALSALAELPPQARLTIIGKGDPGYADEVRARAQAPDLAGRVDVATFQTPEQLITAYCDADVVVFPVRGAEPWGLVPIEAMGLGRPVVSTALGGTAEFVRDGVNAAVIPPDDPASLARAVQRLADDELLRRRIVAGGCQTATRYTAERFDQDTLVAIEQAAQRRGPAPRGSRLRAGGPARTDGRSRWSGRG